MPPHGGGIGFSVGGGGSKKIVRWGGGCLGLPMPPTMGNLAYFLSLKGSTCETRKNVFYFTYLESSFHNFNFSIIQICPSMKHETHFTE